MRARAPGDTVQLSKVRIKEALRQKLESEATREKTTLNAVLAARLDRSYRESEALGGPTAHSAFLALADIARIQSHHRGADWLEDRELFDQVLKEWTAMMRRLLRPPPKSKEG